MDMRKLATAVFTLFLCFTAHASLQPGSTPPDDLGHTLEGTQINASSLHGKVLVISFWATWCGYCMKELPVLANLQKIATQRNLNLQVVSVDYMEDRGTYQHAARVLRKQLPNLLVTWDQHGTIGRPYGANHGIPVMVMLHRDGTVAKVHVGYAANMLPSLVDEINALLAEPVPPSPARGDAAAFNVTSPATGVFKAPSRIGQHRAQVNIAAPKCAG